MWFNHEIKGNNFFLSTHGNVHIFFNHYLVYSLFRWLYRILNIYRLYFNVFCVYIYILNCCLYMYLCISISFRFFGSNTMWHVTVCMNCIFAVQSWHYKWMLFRRVGTIGCIFLNLFYQKEDQWLKWSMRLIEGPEPHAAVENDDGLVKYIASTKVCHRLKGSVMLNVTLKVFWISTLGKCIMNRIKTGMEHRRKWNGTFCLFLNWRCWSTIPDYSNPV